MEGALFATLQQGHWAKGSVPRVANKGHGQGQGRGVCMALAGACVGGWVGGMQREDGVTSTSVVRGRGVQREEGERHIGAPVPCAPWWVMGGAGPWGAPNSSCIVLATFSVKAW